jgi:hypothetical protein
MLRDRSHLHYTRVPEFLEWAAQRGYRPWPCETQYEALRLMDKKGTILVGHKRIKSDHITTTGPLTVLVKEWVVEKREAARKLQHEIWERERLEIEARLRDAE